MASIVTHIDSGFLVPQFETVLIICFCNSAAVIRFNSTILVHGSYGSIITSLKGIFFKTAFTKITLTGHFSGICLIRSSSHHENSFLYFYSILSICSILSCFIVRFISFILFIYLLDSYCNSNSHIIKSWDLSQNWLFLRIVSRTSHAQYIIKTPQSCHFMCECPMFTSKVRYLSHREIRRNAIIEIYFWHIRS